MGKEGQLWDDTALINAFDEAISKYKKKHGKVCKENQTSAVVADVTNSSSDVTQEDNSNPEVHDEGNDNGSRVIPEVGETEALETAKGNEVTGSEAPVEHANGSSELPLQDQSQNDLTLQNMDEYNQLYKQYYEVEEQRQTILLKMQNISNWQYSYPSEAPDSGSYPTEVPVSGSYPSEAPVSGLQCGTSATQYNQSSISQLPYGTMVVSCCPCGSQCPMTSCSSSPCPLAGVSGCNLCANPLATKDFGKESAAKDVDIVKMAMGAAERAISMLTDKTSDSKEENNINNGAEQSATSGTDLATVLNAWYSAGLYTGKYLAEQSHAKKQHD